MSRRYYVATYWNDGKVLESTKMTEASAERLAKKMREVGGVTAAEVRRAKEVTVDEIFENPGGWMK